MGLTGQKLPTLYRSRLGVRARLCVLNAFVQSDIKAFDMAAVSEGAWDRGDDPQLWLPVRVDWKVPPYRRLRVCISCVREGDHFEFQQLRWLKRCPMHDRQLVESCPSCGAELVDHRRWSDMRKGWFGCRCLDRLVDVSRVLSNHRRPGQREIFADCEKYLRWCERERRDCRIFVLENSDAVETAHQIDVALGSVIAPLFNWTKVARWLVPNASDQWKVSTFGQSHEAFKQNRESLQRIGRRYLELLDTPMMSNRSMNSFLQSVVRVVCGQFSLIATDAGGNWEHVSQQEALSYSRRLSRDLIFDASDAYYPGIDLLDGIGAALGGEDYSIDALLERRSFGNARRNLRLHKSSRGRSPTSKRLFEVVGHWLVSVPWLLCQRSITRWRALGDAFPFSPVHYDDSEQAMFPIVLLFLANREHPPSVAFGSPNVTDDDIFNDFRRWVREGKRA